MQRNFIFSCLAIALFCSAKKERAAPPPATPELVISTKPADIAKGQEVFLNKGCPACHTVGEGVKIGPDLKGVTARREAKWISKMILSPEVMLKEDEVARKMMEESYVAMPNQGVDANKELPFLLAYLKSAEK